MRFILFRGWLWAVAIRSGEVSDRTDTGSVHLRNGACTNHQVLSAPGGPGIHVEISLLNTSTSNDGTQVTVDVSIRNTGPAAFSLSAVVVTEVETVCVAAARRNIEPSPDCGCGQRVSSSGYLPPQRVGGSRCPFGTVTQMIKACPHNTFTGDRDAAILLCLLDTGARASEFLSINLEDINQARGDILIQQGKGRKPRTVYIGKQSKRAHQSCLWRS